MKMKKYPRRGEVYWVNLDPTVGSEINKRRPVVIVSDDIGNEFSQRVIIAPVTSKASKIFPFEVALELKGKHGKILLDQVRSIDKVRLDGYFDSCDTDTLLKIDVALKKALGLR